MKKFLLKITALILPAFVFAANTHASTYKVSSGEVAFTAIGKPGFLKIKGESNGMAPQGVVEIKDKKATGEFKFDLKSLSTGIALRDEHMKEKYLEVDKFPEATLVLNPIDINEKDLDKSLEKDFSGTLMLHGVAQPINGKFKFDGAKKNVQAQFTIKVDDFKIAIPKYLGVTVSEKVDVEVQTSVVTQ